MQSTYYKMLNSFFFGLYIISRPKLIYLALFRGVYLPVFVQFEWLKEFNIKTMIDVGAHKGRVSQTVFTLFPSIKIFAFEPNVTLIDSIKNKIPSKNLTIETNALSNKIESKIIYIAEDTTLTSLMPLVIPEKRAGMTVKSKKKTVKTITLDEYFRNINLKEDVFLKIDTEGAEGLILQGARKFLKKVKVIHIETYYKRLYKDQLLFNKIYDLLIKEDFEYKGEISEAYFYPKFELPMITNSVFVKK